MHILLIHQAFAALDEAGGTRHIEFANSLSKVGIKFTIVASEASYLSGEISVNPAGAHPQSPDNAAISIKRIKAKHNMHANFRQRLFSYIGFMFSSFWSALSVKKLDVVWGTSPPIFQAFTAMKIAKIKRLPFIFEVRDLWPDFAIELGIIRNKLVIGLSRWLERTLIRQADVVIVNSPGYIEHVTALGAKRVELIPNGADPEMFDPAATGNSVRKRLGLKGKFLVCYTGAHGISNDLGIVLDAAKLLIDQPQIHFLLVGDGKEKRNLVAKAEKIGLNNITFLPAMPKSEIKEVLAASNACLAILKPINLYKTTYPNKVFDYMAAGRAVICAIDGAIRKVVEKHGAGLFIQPGNAYQLAEKVKYLCGHPDSVKGMGIAGRKAIKTYYDRQIISLKLESLIRSLETHE